MNNYKNMSDEEIKEQLEWSDHHEFSYGYSIWAFEKIKQLKKQKDDVVEYIKNDLKLINDFKLYQDGAFELLRMLGEIDVED